ncbi:MAG: N-acetylmuramoyl-L-alanine amidase [Ruminococcaceae bacterium]|nr:N-acetylmuramoyl-L-alanine amidase [Oscillospiraceae bacterium]
MPIKIFIDQGHNPVNPNAGAEGNGIREQDINYEVGIALAAMLNSNENFEARLSRNSPDEVLGTSTAESLSARVNSANSWPADYFISIHANSSDISTASGSEAYVYSRDGESFNFAESMLESLNNLTGLPNRGVFARPTLYVLRKTSMPAVLLELGYVSNPYEASLMSQRPELFAEGIYNGILKYFDLY